MDYDLIRRKIQKYCSSENYIYLIQKEERMLTSSLYLTSSGFADYSNATSDIFEELTGIIEAADFPLGVTVITNDFEKLITQYNPELGSTDLLELIVFQEFNLKPSSEDRQAVLEKSIKQEKIKNTLVWACYINDRAEFLKRLEKASQSQLDKNLKMIGTPLGLCAEHDDLESFKLLLEKGANLLKKSFVATPIQLAFSCSDSITFYLLENYKDDVVREIEKKGFLLAAGNTNRTILEAVYSLGADLYGKDPYFPNLHNFADSDNVAGLQFLLDNGVDINCKNKQGKTALDRAILHKKAKAIDFLTKHGAETTEA